MVVADKAYMIEELPTLSDIRMTEMWNVSES